MDEDESSGSGWRRGGGTGSSYDSQSGLSGREGGAGVSWGIGDDGKLPVRDRKGGNAVSTKLEMESFEVGN